MIDAGGPIGVFDSGIGGLSVLRALRSVLPQERFIYLGDTARLPYGTKSAASVVRYSLQCAEALVARRIRCLVVACNTASASALDALRLRYPAIPVIGVIEPGAAAAVSASRTRHVAVIGTEGTIGGGAYQAAIQRLDARVRVTAQACSLFVAVAEEGWVAGPIAEAIAHRYLDPIFSAGHSSGAASGVPDTLVLGCTHFPVLAATLRAVLPDHVVLVDSAATVAAAVTRELPPTSNPSEPGGVTWLATDGAARFARVSGVFLGETLRAEDIEIIDL
ncbi:MAG: glutamate racemase [Gammaproteobacteria bacterium]|nr:glutamate racemase [Gammaproteobacteria bacterium]